MDPYVLFRAGQTLEVDWRLKVIESRAKKHLHLGWFHWILKVVVRSFIHDEGVWGVSTRPVIYTISTRPTMSVIYGKLLLL